MSSACQNGKVAADIERPPDDDQTDADQHTRSSSQPMKRPPEQPVAPDHQGLTTKAGHATNLLWVLTSFDAFDLLYTGRCLSADGAAEVLTSAVERALCR